MDDLDAATRADDEIETAAEERREREVPPDSWRSGLELWAPRGGPLTEPDVDEARATWGRARRGG